MTSPNPTTLKKKDQDMDHIDAMQQQQLRYDSSHPLLAQPPFQPVAKPSIPRKPVTNNVHKSREENTQGRKQLNLQVPVQPPIPEFQFIPYSAPPSQALPFPSEYLQPNMPYRSLSLPHVMPSYQLVQPGYYYPSMMTQPPLIPQYYHRPTKTSEPVSSVFKKTCYKCGNLGHYAEECEFEERLCYNCKKPGHETSECPESRSTELKQCYVCRKIGHLQSNCPTRQPQFVPGAVMTGPPPSSGHISAQYGDLRAAKEPGSPGSQFSFSNSPNSSPPPPPTLHGQQYYSPGFMHQRTLYLQTAHTVFQNNQVRAGSEPFVNYQKGNYNGRGRSDWRNKSSHSSRQKGSLKSNSFSEDVVSMDQDELSEDSDGKK